MATKPEQKANQKSKSNGKKVFLILIPIVIVVILAVVGCVLWQNSHNDDAANQEGTNSSENAETTAGVKANLGDKYVDLDNRSFAVNGKVYTLGKTTLQEMIDDGVPFDENDIANANNNLNKNHESESFDINLGKYYSAQVRVINDSDENQKIADCKISQIYLPVKEDQEQDIIEFAFPLTVSREEIIANAGEPTDQSDYKGDNDYHSEKIEYKVASDKYYGNSGYAFEFVNGKLRYVTISYK